MTEIFELIEDGSSYAKMYNTVKAYNRDYSTIEKAFISRSFELQLNKFVDLLSTQKHQFKDLFAETKENNKKLRTALSIFQKFELPEKFKFDATVEECIKYQSKYNAADLFIKLMIPLKNSQNAQYAIEKYKLEIAPKTQEFSFNNFESMFIDSHNIFATHADFNKSLNEILNGQKTNILEIYRSTNIYYKYYSLFANSNQDEGIDEDMIKNMQVFELKKPEIKKSSAILKIDGKSVDLLKVRKWMNKTIEPKKIENIIIVETIDGKNWRKLNIDPSKIPLLLYGPNPWTELLNKKHNEIIEFNSLGKNPINFSTDTPDMTDIKNKIYTKTYALWKSGKLNRDSILNETRTIFFKYLKNYKGSTDEDEKLLSFISTIKGISNKYANEIMKLDQKSKEIQNNILEITESIFNNENNIFDKINDKITLISLMAK